MEKNSPKTGVHLLYKNPGETPNECILRFKKDNPDYGDTSMTYAGRLDPMAEGLLLVLSGGEIKHKERYLDLQKTYEFDVLWGVNTDTLDVLGLIHDKVDSVPSEKELMKYVENSIGKVEQSYPIYSSRPVGGKSLFQWAREGRISEIDIPKHEVEIFEAEYISRRTINKKDLSREVTSNISNVRGDFRQQEILEKWREFLKKNKEKEFVIDKFTVTVSSGFYVRQFVSDMADSLKLKATTFHIKRTKVGIHSLA